jgi:hypothetical protein
MSRLCPSCQWALKRGLAIGGFIGGLAVAIWKAMQ